MYQREAERLRRELDCVKKRRGPCFPDDLKRRVAAWIAEQRTAGVTVAALASELGLSSGTVLKWSSTMGPRNRALVPVQIVPEPMALEPVSIVSPAGYRIERLSFSAAIAMLKALG